MISTYVRFSPSDEGGEEVRFDVTSTGHEQILSIHTEGQSLDTSCLSVASSSRSLLNSNARSSSSRYCGRLSGKVFDQNASGDVVFGGFVEKVDQVLNRGDSECIIAWGAKGAAKKRTLFGFDSVDGGLSSRFLQTVFSDDRFNVWLQGSIINPEGEVFEDLLVTSKPRRPGPRQHQCDDLNQAMTYFKTFHQNLEKHDSAAPNNVCTAQCLSVFLEEKDASLSLDIGIAALHFIVLESGDGERDGTTTNFTSNAAFIERLLFGSSSTGGGSKQDFAYDSLQQVIAGCTSFSILGVVSSLQSEIGNTISIVKILSKISQRDKDVSGRSNVTGDASSLGTLSMLATDIMANRMEGSYPRRKIEESPIIPEEILAENSLDSLEKSLNALDKSNVLDKSTHSIIHRSGSLSSSILNNSTREEQLRMIKSLTERNADGTDYRSRAEKLEEENRVLAEKLKLMQEKYEKSNSSVSKPLSTSTSRSQLQSSKFDPSDLVDKRMKRLADVVFGGSMSHSVGEDSHSVGKKEDKPSIFNKDDENTSPGDDKRTKIDSKGTDRKSLDTSCKTIPYKSMRGSPNDGEIGGDNLMSSVRSVQTCLVPTVLPSPADLDEDEDDSISANRRLLTYPDAKSERSVGEMIFSRFTRQEQSAASSWGDKSASIDDPTPDFGRSLKRSKKGDVLSQSLRSDDSKKSSPSSFNPITQSLRTTKPIRTSSPACRVNPKGSEEHCSIEHSKLTLQGLSIHSLDETKSSNKGDSSRNLKKESPLKSSSKGEEIDGLSRSLSRSRKSKDLPTQTNFGGLQDEEKDPLLASEYSSDDDYDRKDRVDKLWKAALAPSPEPISKTQFKKGDRSCRPEALAFGEERPDPLTNTSARNLTPPAADLIPPTSVSVKLAPPTADEIGCSLLEEELSVFNRSYVVKPKPNESFGSFGLSPVKKNDESTHEMLELAQTESGLGAEESPEKDATSGESTNSHGPPMAKSHGPPISHRIEEESPDLNLSEHSEDDAILFSTPAGKALCESLSKDSYSRDNDSGINTIATFGNDGFMAEENEEKPDAVIHDLLSSLNSLPSSSMGGHRDGVDRLPDGAPDSYVAHNKTKILLMNTTPHFSKDAPLELNSVSKDSALMNLTAEESRNLKTAESSPDPVPLSTVADFVGGDAAYDEGRPAGRNLMNELNKPGVISTRERLKRLLCEENGSSDETSSQSVPVDEPQERYEECLEPMVESNESEEREDNVPNMVNRTADEKEREIARQLSEVQNEADNGARAEEEDFPPIMGDLPVLTSSGLPPKSPTGDPRLREVQDGIRSLLTSKIQDKLSREADSPKYSIKLQAKNTSAPLNSNAARLKEQAKEQSQSAPKQQSKEPALSHESRDKTGTFVKVGSVPSTRHSRITGAQISLEAFAPTEYEKTPFAVCDRLRNHVFKKSRQSETKSLYPQNTVADRISRITTSPLYFYKSDGGLMNSMRASDRGASSADVTEHNIGMIISNKPSRDALSLSGVSADQSEEVSQDYPGSRDGNIHEEDSYCEGPTSAVDSTSAEFVTAAEIEAVLRTLKWKNPGLALGTSLRGDKGPARRSSANNETIKNAPIPNGSKGSAGSGNRSNNDVKGKVRQRSATPRLVTPRDVMNGMKKYSQMKREESKKSEGPYKIRSKTPEYTGGAKRSSVQQNGTASRGRHTPRNAATPRGQNTPRGTTPNDDHGRYMAKTPTRFLGQAKQMISAKDQILNATLANVEKDSKHSTSSSSRGKFGTKQPKNAMKIPSQQKFFADTRKEIVRNDSKNSLGKANENAMDGDDEEILEEMVVEDGDGELVPATEIAMSARAALQLSRKANSSANANPNSKEFSAMKFRESIYKNFVPKERVSANMEATKGILQNQVPAGGTVFHEGQPKGPSQKANRISQEPNRYVQAQRSYPSRCPPEFVKAQAISTVPADPPSVASEGAVSGNVLLSSKMSQNSAFMENLNRIRVIKGGPHGTSNTANANFVVSREIPKVGSAFYKPDSEKPSRLLGGIISTGAKQNELVIRPANDPREIVQEVNGSKKLLTSNLAGRFGGAKKEPGKGFSAVLGRQVAQATPGGVLEVKETNPEKAAVQSKKAIAEETTKRRVQYVQNFVDRELSPENRSLFSSKGSKNTVESDGPHVYGHAPANRPKPSHTGKAPSVVPSAGQKPPMDTNLRDGTSQDAAENVTFDKQGKTTFEESAITNLENKRDDSLSLSVTSLFENGRGPQDGDCSGMNHADNDQNENQGNPPFSTQPAQQIPGQSFLMRRFQNYAGTKGLHPFGTPAESPQIANYNSLNASPIDTSGPIRNLEAMAKSRSMLLLAQQKKGNAIPVCQNSGVKGASPAAPTTNSVTTQAAFGSPRYAVPNSSEQRRQPQSTNLEQKVSKPTQRERNSTLQKRGKKVEVKAAGNSTMLTNPSVSSISMQSDNSALKTRSSLFASGWIHNSIENGLSDMMKRRQNSPIMKRRQDSPMLRGSPRLESPSGQGRQDSQPRVCGNLITANASPYYPAVRSSALLGHMAQPSPRTHRPSNAPTPTLSKSTEGRLSKSAEGRPCSPSMRSNEGISRMEGGPGQKLRKREAWHVMVQTSMSRDSNTNPSNIRIGPSPRD